MADDTTVQDTDEQQTEQPEEKPTPEAQADIDGLKRKTQELLAEVKEERAKRRELEAEKERIEQERLERDQNYKELSERHKKEAEALRQELDDLRRENANKALEGVATELGAEYGSNAANAKILKRILRDELDFVDGQVVAKNHASIQDLVAHMEQSGDYASLWKGSQAAGGGALGANGGGAAMANPWKPDERNLTEQARIKRENPQLAARLMAEASTTSR